VSRRERSLAAPKGGGREVLQMAVEDPQIAIGDWSYWVARSYCL